MNHPVFLPARSEAEQSRSQVECAPVAQLEERLRPKEKVGGSIPPGGES